MMKAWTLEEIRHWQREDPTGDLVLYGAGDLGKLALDTLTSDGLRVSAFCDDSLLKQGTEWRGVPIISASELAGYDRSTRVLLAMNYLAAVRPRLASMGFERVSSCASLFESVDLSSARVGVHQLEVDRKVAWHVRECAKVVKADHLTLKYVDVVITEACSMRCADCSNLMQYYRRPRNADFDQLCEDIRLLVNAVDWIDEIRVLGGEPFINKRFADIVRHVLGYANFRHLIVYTNATILPPPPALEVLRDPRVIVNITNYGHHSRKLDEFVSMMKDAGISHLVKEPSWTDSGRIQRQSKSPEELDRQFQQCCVNDVLTLLHGRVYRCPFSANLTNLQAAPIDPSEMTALNIDRAQLRENLRALYGRQSHLTACGYCRGRDYTVPKIEPAIQVAAPLELPMVQPVTSKT